MRYIDDIFLIWTDNTKELHDFHLFLNSMDADLKFTVVESKSEIQVLDTTVCIDQHALTTPLYRKQTDRNTLLRFDSCHPRKMVKSLPHSQMLRARRVESSGNSLTSTLDIMTCNFRERGYPLNLITTQRHWVEHSNRQIL